MRVRIYNPEARDGGGRDRAEGVIHPDKTVLTLYGFVIK